MRRAVLKQGNSHLPGRLVRGILSQQAVNFPQGFFRLMVFIECFAEHKSGLWIRGGQSIQLAKGSDGLLEIIFDDIGCSDSESGVRQKRINLLRPQELVTRAAGLLLPQQYAAQQNVA